MVTNSGNQKADEAFDELTEIFEESVTKAKEKQRKEKA